MFTTGNDLLVDLDGDDGLVQAQFAHEVAHGGVVGQIALFAVDGQLHGNAKEYRNRIAGDSRRRRDAFSSVCR